MNDAAAEPVGEMAPAPETSAPASRLRVWHLVVAGLLAAGLAWPFAMKFEKTFPQENLSVEMTNRIRARADDPIAWAKDRQNYWEHLYRNGVLRLGIFCICMGGCLGIATAATRYGSLLVRIRGVLTGLLLGAVAGVGSGFSAAAMAYYIDKNMRDADVTIRSPLIHGAGWIIPALMCGVILGLTSGNRRQVVPTTMLHAFGGVLGAFFATMLYEPLAGWLFQLDRTDIPFPEGTANKFLFMGLAAVLMMTSAWWAGVAPLVRRSSPRA